MTKEKKAKAITSALGNTELNWISYDASIRGYIGFKVKGITEVVLVPSFCSVSRGCDEIAEAIKEAGLDYGHYAEIVDRYEALLEFKRKRAKVHQDNFDKFRQELSEVIQEKIERRALELIKQSQQSV